MVCAGNTGARETTPMTDAALGTAEVLQALFFSLKIVSHPHVVRRSHANLRWSRTRSR